MVVSEKNTTPEKKFELAFFANFKKYSLFQKVRNSKITRGTAAGATGPLVSRLNGYGELLCLVAGAWGDCSTHLHELIVTCAESRVAHLCRSTGRPELESQLGVVTGQYRRLLSACIVRAQAQCLISRIGVISPEARVAAQRREVAGRLERELRKERQAQ